LIASFDIIAVLLRDLHMTPFAQANLPLPQPYLLFLGDITDAEYAKTAFGLRDWARERCVGEYACAGTTVTTGLPFLTPVEATAMGARALVIGVANEGGFIADAWMPALLSALEAGLDIISGMHTRLADIAPLKAGAAHNGRRLIDVRRPPPNIPIATGRKRSGKRLLTVGTDCAIGKKYTALAVTRAFLAREVATHFRATGQTGIMIAGGGIPIDAVVADFAAGAAEILSPDAANDHWDVIEGQGSLFHPAYSGVSLALLHGSQPDVVVICHEPGRERILGVPGYTLPSVEEMIQLALRLGGRTNPAIRCGGVSLNTAELDETSADRLLAEESERLGLPVADPMRGGTRFETLIDHCLRQ
jgi:D-glutamate N-acetyltransferase